MVLAHNIDEVQRTEDIQICQDTTFDTMMLSPDILYGLKSSGFIKPSPIQLLGIPLGKLGFDLLLEAKSGTGKTVVFSTIALEKLNLSNGLQVIIITPTREIAVQICDVLKQIGSKCEGLTIEVAIGGLPYQEDIDKMKKNVHILVGTPGRLKYLIQDKNVDTSAIRLFILDEADKLMEKSFKTDIKYIHSALPNQKQVIMSSATYPESVIDVINELVQDAQRVCPNSSNVLLGVSHRITYVKYNCNSVRQTEIRFEELTKILTETQFKQCVIFCKYQARVSQLHKMLTKAKWPSELVYGKQNQTVRLDALKTLQEYKCRILISTDLVSRGIDAKNVDLVINFEPPDSCETYLHRIGRSGRYGSIGMAISIVSEGVERKNFHTMLQPIESSIILQHFWTGEYMNHCMNETKQTVEIKNKSECNFEQTNNNHENLWNFILCYTKDSNKIESFDQLCLSYNIISNKDEIIESFSDILQSYQNMDDNEIEDSTEYKQMKYENFLYKNYLTAVRNLKHKFEINCVNTNNGSKSNGASDGCLVYKQENQIKSILRNSEESSQNIDYKLDIINSQIQKELQNNNHSMPRKKEENYIDATNFISQIPKAFHESACEKKHKQNIRTNQDVLKNGVSSDINSKSSKVEQKYRPSMKNHQDNKNYISPDIKLSDTNYLSLYSNHKHDELLYKKKKNNECNVNLFVKPAIINNETSHAADLDYDYGIQDVKNVDHQFNREKSYYQWYHQLKNNMKQIEQFLYIDEMNNP